MTQTNDQVDVLIIGAGASGAAFAWSLADANINVMCLEQGDWLEPAKYPTTRIDWELYRQAEFNPNPNMREHPRGLPGERVGHPHSAADVQRGGRQHHPLECPLPSDAPIGLPGEDSRRGG